MDPTVAMLAPTSATTNNLDHSQRHINGFANERIHMDIKNGIQTNQAFSKNSLIFCPQRNERQTRQSKIRPLFAAAGVYAPSVSDTARVTGVSSGLVGEKTKFTFRSRCQHIFFLIQISLEV